MKYLKYSYVDSVTGVCITEAPAAGGPIAPNVPGLVFGFALESLFPTGEPIMFGTADSVDAKTPGVLAILTKAEYEQAQADEMAARAAQETGRWPEQIAERRWHHETGGIVLGGIPVATDDRSKTLINGAALRASRDPDYTLRWKTAEGFIDLPADQVLLMADAVADHVQACFDREAGLLAAVTDGSFTAEMLEQGWPA